MVLVLGVANDFPLMPGYVGFHVIRLWIALKSVFGMLPLTVLLWWREAHLMAAGEDGNLVPPPPPAAFIGT